MNDSFKQQSVKLIAMYLPQFHCIPENDEFWGKGFTDWVTVKNAKPLFNGHQQPRVPLNTNYYDLSLKENIVWQAKLAKEYGVYGFGIYHYWFNNEKNLLTKPAEIIIENKDINIRFFFSWDNTLWKRSWSNVRGGNSWAPAYDNTCSKNAPEILIPYILGDEKDWGKHYSYLLDYFKDPRYIKKDNKPLFIIFHYDPKISLMCDYWNNLAKGDGFDGVYFIFRYNKIENIPKHEMTFKYEPAYSGWTPHTFYERLLNKCRPIFNYGNLPKRIDYEWIWKRLINNAIKMNQRNVFHGAFVSYDDTPRRGTRGIVVRKADSTIFRKYIIKLKEVSENQGKEFIFLTAWNEWGEGAYLEPDEINKYNYLEAVRDCFLEK